MSDRLKAELLRWQAVNAAMEMLSASAKSIILGRLRGKALKDIAKEQKLTKEHARQRGQRALDDLEAFLFPPPVESNHG